MNLFEEAFNKAGVKATDFEDREVNEKELKFDEEIEFLDTWLKMLKRNASEKEQHLYLTKHGFVSKNQFNLYMAVTNDADDLQMKLDDEEEFMCNRECIALKKEIEEKRNMAENIKRPTYYLMVMSRLGKKDVSPYGEDVLKSIATKYTNRERVWKESDFKNCLGFGCF